MALETVRLPDPRPISVSSATGTAANAAIRIAHLDKVFITVRNERVHALDDISLTVKDKEFVTIVGPSGCGKSTLLKIIAGLLPASSGQLRVVDQPVLKPRRDIGVVFQSPVLLPWRTVLENVLLPAEVQHLPSGPTRARARDLLKMVGLADFENKYPGELSGGMQQRAAISRGLICDPAILLMDEPFGALDAMTREQMNLDLQRIWRESGKTIVLITHSIPEAVFLGDRVVVMTPRPGRIACTIDVPLPRPRGLDAMGDPAFGRLTSDIRRLLYSLSDAAPAHEGGGLG
ncbi:ABC transporter ATP-binding protein [Aquabacter spiritensis]|uniref:NitT/TauT family transport system ATP-binding protein n=1 Tax=Aquabacter spiritensis TaxID=933073 RepID=A0A4R3M1Q3_9HYPH|nr:ABC transporter ATP-binding protein [Aquabacter spiritensis]TCT06109.1 NitT/TauT family transport system ATP-binding protein [Aquabacter spiritensis]